MDKKIFDEIASIIKNHKPNINLSEKNLDATLKSLNVDSLDAIGIIVDVEKRLNVRIDESALVKLHTLGDLLNMFEKQVNH